MARKVIQVALNGVTGRMGYRQHLVRSLLAIREQGGIPLGDGSTVLYPEPILVGRSEERLRAIAERHGLARWTTSLDEVLGDPEVDVYFDTQVTSAREDAVARAIAAGKHVYTEKPVAASAAAAFALAEAAQAAGITHGVVQDKLFLPGMIKLRRLIREGFFGRVLSVRVEFGYWVFEGDGIPAQRPSWNYRAQDGGGIVLDMFPHWQYLLEDLFGPVSAVYARRATHLPRRWDEAGEPYDVTADDAAYAVLEFASGAVASVNSSWAVRVNRRELLELQVDGTHGSAVAGLRNCAVQHKVSTPMPVWNPDLPDPLDYQAMWTDVPDNMDFDNGFKAQWELFLRDAALGRPFRWDLFAGARGVQLAELAMRSSAEGRRVEVTAGDTRMSARITLPGRAAPLEVAAPGWAAGYPPPTSRRVYAAAHVASIDGGDLIDWEATLRFRDHLWSHGFAVAEAMDTAQRGMGLSWWLARELIASTAERAAARRAAGRFAGLACGAGTDHLAAGKGHSITGDHRRLRRPAGVRSGGGPVGRRGVILMASRALAAAARGPRDYLDVYGAVLKQATPAGHPALARRGVRPGAARLLGRRRLRVRGGDRARADRPGRRQGGRHQAVGARRGQGGGAAPQAPGRDPPLHRRRLRLRRPDQGRRHAGHSDALLGAFAAVTAPAAAALHALDAGDLAGYEAAIGPTVPLSRLHLRGADVLLQGGRGLPGLAERLAAALFHARRL